jgi:lysophospholipid acyltransferase (LPLAT)-like uncharacterized protein
MASNLVRSLYGGAVGAPALSAFRVLSRTLLVSAPHRPPPELLTNTIVVCWHQDLYLYLLTHLDQQHWRRHIWFVHDDMLTQPMHHMLRALGARRLVMGSAGHAGAREAADEVAAHLARPSEGWRTLINPDGPLGPPHRIKKGVLWMSAQAQVPIVPIRFACSSQVELPWPWWDAKRVPLPGAAVTVEYGAPCQVPRDFVSADFDKYAGPLTAFLNRVGG